MNGRTPVLTSLAMLQRVLTIALNAYRESMRARILLGLAGVAFAVSLYSLVVGSFTLEQAPRVVSDLGAASISFFGVAVAIVIGATSLHRELEQKTIFPILARPIGRGEYIVGKFLGTLLTIVVFIMADAGLVLLLAATIAGKQIPLIVGTGVGSIAIFAIAAIRFPWARTFGPIPWALALLVAGIVLSGGAPDERRLILSSAVLSFLEVGIITAIATLFSSFSTPFLSALFTLGTFLIGRNADSLARLPKKFFGETLADAALKLSKVVPNLQVFVPPRPILTGQASDVAFGNYLAHASLTALGWSVGMLAVAVIVFRRRDFL